LAVILFGADVPFLLRKANDENRDYDLMGDAFVYGVMNGELIEGTVTDDLENLSEKDFRLR
jgi:hypothetical protein